MINLLSRAWLILLILLIASQKAFSANVDSYSEADKGYGASNYGDSTTKPKRNYHIQFTSEAPDLNGKLDDICWKQGEWQSDYTQFSPNYKGEASHKTHLKILYDEKNIYVAFRVSDDMSKVSRKLGRRDSYTGDVVGIMFDSYFDHRTAFEFDITSAGQKIDVWVSNDGWDINWNAVWDGKVAYEDSAWTAELRIPFSQLRYSTAQEQIWGLNSWRLIDRSLEETHRNLVANDGTGLVYTYGELHGLQGLKKAKRIELAPYLSGKMTTQHEISGNPFTKSPAFGGQAGLDAKIGITNNFTLDATINPDFGQVEADPSVMNLSAFETYFEEKRPFFVEGKNIFDFTFDSDQMFYTRRIGHAPSYFPNYNSISIPENTTIGGAFKLSGKTAKGLSVGIIESVTLKEMADIHNDNTDFSQPVEPLSNYLIGRFQKESDKGNTLIGGILTYSHRFINDNQLNFLSSNAITYGLDFTRYWNDRKYFMLAKAIGSNINGDILAISRLQASSARYYQRPDMKRPEFDSTLTQLNGAGASLQAGKWSKGHWRYNEELIYRSPGLELNDLGYMPIADIMKNNTNVTYFEKENTRVFKTYDFALQQQNAWNSHGDGLYSMVSLMAESEFMNSWFARIQSKYTFRTTDERLLRGGPAMKAPDLLEFSYMLHSNYSKNLYFSVSGSHSRGIENNLENFSLSAEISYRPRPKLVLSLQPVYQKNVDELQYIGQFNTSVAKKTYLLGKVDNRNLGITFRADLDLTPELTFQYYGSPFVSIGKYSNFKEILDPLNPEYTNRFKILAPSGTGQEYHFDTNGDGTTDITIPNPDFNYQQFRSNLVLRWEYRTGSTLYLVWSQDRTDFEQAGSFDFRDGYKNMSGIYPKNIFMIKFSYWFSAF